MSENVQVGLRSNSLLAAVILAKREAVLMSRKHCHARNVSSIVIENNDGCLVRAFLAWPGHRLNTNHLDDELAVGIHNHRYNISLMKIAGSVRHTTYTEISGNAFYEWAFRSVLNGETAKPELLGMSGLKVQTDCTLGNDWLTISQEVLHDVSCEGPAGWWVREGRLQTRQTKLFTKSPTVATEGLYEPFLDRDEVIRHVAEWCSTCG